jgi:P27 family predicted phage terminase small subunit
LKKCRDPAAKGLSPEAKRWRAKLTREYDIVDEAGLLILQTALEAFDRMRQAQQQVAADGVTFTDRFGQIKAHPLLPVERDARAAFLAGLRSLNLDLEPLHDGPGRPAGRSNGPRHGE